MFNLGNKASGIRVMGLLMVESASAFYAMTAQSNANNLIKEVLMNNDIFDSVDVRDLGNLDLLARQVVEGFIIGLHKSPFHGFSVEFAEHRLYNPGESTRDIDWKVFARTEKLFVKRFEEETNLRCQIVVDVSSSMAFPEKPDGPGGLNKLRFSILAAASLMNLLRRQRDAFGLTLFDTDIREHTRAKSSTTHYQLLLTYLQRGLSQTSVNSTTDIATTLHHIAESIHRRSMVILLSDMFEGPDQAEELFSALQHLKYNKHEVVLFHVIDKSRELEFDFPNRPHLFIDLETGERVRLNPGQIRDQYTKEVREFTRALQLKCMQYHIDFVEADIRAGFRPVLQSYLVRRRKMMV